MERAQGVGDSAVDFFLLTNQGQLCLDVLDVEVANSLVLAWRGGFCERSATWEPPGRRGPGPAPRRRQRADT